MAEDKFKLPRSSYDELVKIIKAYGRMKGEGSNDDIAQLSGIGKTRVSSNNSFLLGVEIVEGGRKKTPTSKGQELARALEHEIQKEISRAWRKIVEENDFLNKMVQAVSVRKGMEISQLENHIAYSSGEARSKEVMTGARTIIDILRVSELVSENGDKVIPNEAFPKEIELAESPSIGQPIVKQATSSEESQTISVQHSIPKSVTHTGISLHVEVRINATVDELEGLGEKLKRLVSDLSTTTANDNSIESS